MTSTPSNTPKAVREALCAAQSALHERGRSGIDVHSVPGWVAQIGVLIDEVDRHRPLGVDGKHGERRHTRTCGCDGHCAPWSIDLAIAGRVSIA